MSSDNSIPEGLKFVAPYLQRAIQLQEREPIVSYYSNYYAAKLSIGKASKENRAFIDELLSVLEQQRKDIGPNEAISNDLAGFAYIKNFALKIFSRADDEDRKGLSSQKTAKNFVAAANFLELLKVFGDIDSEIEEKIKYSKWKAADIIKAIREGRQPTPAPLAQSPSLSSDGTTMPGNPMSSPPLQTLEVQDGVSSGSSSVVDPFGLSSPPVAAPTFVNNNQSAQYGNTGVQGGFQGGPSGFPTISNFPSPPLANANGGYGDQQGYSNPQASAGSMDWNAPGQNNNVFAQPPPVVGDYNQQYNQPGTQQPFSVQQHQQPQQPVYQPQQPQQPYNTYQQSGLTPQSGPGTPFGAPVNNNSYGIQPSAPPVQQQPYKPQPTPPVQSPTPQQQPPAQVYTPVTIPAVLDPAIVTQAQKHCKWTVSALTYDDIPTAIENLEKALALLRPYQK